MRSLFTPPALKWGSLAVGAIAATVAISSTMASFNGSASSAPDTVSHHTNILDAFDAIDGPAILEVHNDAHFARESVEVGTSESRQTKLAYMFDENGAISQFLLTRESENGPAETLFDGVTLHQVEDGTYRSEDIDQDSAAADRSGPPNLVDWREFMAEVIASLRPAEAAGVLTRAPSARPGFDELRVAVSVDEATALLDEESVPGLTLPEPDSALPFALALTACESYVRRMNDFNIVPFNYAFVVNSSGHSATGGRCWIGEDGEPLDVFSIYQTWSVYRATDWDALVAELAPGLAAILLD